MKVYKATDKDMKCRGFQYELGDNGEVKAILAGIVDGETLKPGVWYTVKNGQWVEVQ